MPASRALEINTYMHYTYVQPTPTISLHIIYDLYQIGGGQHATRSPTNQM